QINADGSFDFDANGAFDGLGAGETATTSITYEVSDGQGGTDTSTLTVTINGANAAPTDGDETGAVGAGDGVTSLTNALINVSDPDLTDTHTVSAVSGGTVGGSVAGTNGGFFAIASDGTATFDPNGAFNSLADAATETTAVTYTVSDGNGGTDTSTMTVTVTGANDAPTVSTAPSDQTVQDKANIALDLSATFADIDTGDSMTYSATGLPTGLTISSTGVVSGTIDISDPLTAISPTVTLTGTDGGGATASTSFTYNVGLNVEDSEVPSSSDYTITGGAGPDTVVDGINSASGAGNTGVINLGNGANTLTIGTSAALGGTLSYTGGTGVDTISIGDDAATGSGVMNLNLGDDSVTDVITFQGSVSHPSSGGGVTITNFDAAEDFLILAGMSMTSNVSITSTGSGVNIASTGSAPVFVDVDVVGSTNVSDYNLSINGSGDLLIS
ncbi:MAG: beta strand repeat-containing protein, partial [Alphaproteobacteria bacterium]